MATKSTRDILIIGGGAAGTTAAEAYRAGGGTGSVTIVSDEEHPLYSRVLLPHAAKGKIAPEKAFLKKREWYGEKGIEFLAGRRFLRVNYKEKTATLDGGDEIAYGKLVIAVGGKPRGWEVPGAQLQGVLHLQTYEDALALREALKPGSRMAIVGSGFIAIEFAAACVEKGVTAVLLNRGPHFWTSALGPAVGGAVQAALEAQGVEVRDNVKAEAALGEEAIAGVQLSDGKTVPCATVGIGIGVEIPCDPFGDLRGEHGILADAFLKAKHADVWVAGDCCEYEDEVTGVRRSVGNWTNAIAQGRHVGKALLGAREKFIMLTSYSTAVFPGVNLIFLGETRKHPAFERYERVLEEGRKIVEFNVKEGRVVGAVLLNASDLRAACSALIMSGVPLKGRETLLSDPAAPLDAF